MPRIFYDNDLDLSDLKESGRRRSSQVVKKKRRAPKDIKLERNGF